MKAKEERKHLENMIDQASDAIDVNVPKSGDTPELKNELAFELDFDKLGKTCNRKAKKLIKNATGFVFSDESVKQNNYLKNKIEIDVVSLSGMLYQMECTRIMQKSLMEEVQHGAQHPRMYEVFSGLSKTIGDLNKQLIQTVEAIKVTYMDMKENIKSNSEQLALNSKEGFMRNENGIIALGSKDLINQTKALKMNKNKERDNDKNIEDAKEINE